LFLQVCGLIEAMFFLIEFFGCWCVLIFYAGFGCDEFGLPRGCVQVVFIALGFVKRAEIM